nr:hypothetical protein BaRGS_003877 [Batillaria attramentaria]
MEWIASDYEQHSQKALKDPHFYLANPVNAFLLIKRFTLDWDRQMSPVVSNHSWEEFNQDLQYARQDLPTFEDLTVEDCFLLGRLSYMEKDLYHTTLWMQEALDLETVAPPEEKNIPRKEILDYLSYTLAMKIKDGHKLTCRYVHNNNPLLILQPAKEETMHIDPWLVLYHDVMSDKEISDIKFLATPKVS